VAHASCAMASGDTSEELESRLLRRLHASCLAAPLAVWYPATPTARADGAAAQYATPGGARLSAGSIDESGPSPERVQHILQAKDDLLGEQHPEQRTGRQQPGSANTERPPDAFHKQIIEVRRLLQSVASAQTNDGQSQQVSRTMVHHLLLVLCCSSLVELSITFICLFNHLSLPCVQVERLLGLLEHRAATSTGAAALPLLDCACALAFMLISHWHSSSTGWQASSEAASGSDSADSRQPPPHWPAALQRVSACISALIQRSACQQTNSTAAGSSQLVASQIASLLAAWAPDFAAAEPLWRQLFSYAAASVGHVSSADIMASVSSRSPAADRIALPDDGVGGKVRAICLVSEILP
jgi:hypothetical protein